MISCSSSHLRKTMIYFHSGPFWHCTRTRPVFGCYAHVVKIFVGFKNQGFFNLLFFFFLHDIYRQPHRNYCMIQLAWAALIISDTAWSLWEKNYSPPALASSQLRLWHERISRLQQPQHPPPPPPYKNLSLGLQLIMAVIRFVCQAVRPCVFRPRDSLLS